MVLGSACGFGCCLRLWVVHVALAGASGFG